MKIRRQKAGLRVNEEDRSGISISYAWSQLARLGFPARYGGRAQDGSYEYVVIDPKTGQFIATGKGPTLEQSMCEAAINAQASIGSG